MNTSKQAIDAKRIVVLIHGTFATDTEWVRDDSKVSLRLREEYGDKLLITRFRWSGRNLHRARLMAGRRLRSHIRRAVDRYEIADVLLIAHSHGGNVALYALDDPAVACTVSGVVSLGTPFLWTSRRHLADSVRFLIAVLPVCIGALWIFSLVGLMLFLAWLSEQFDPYGGKGFIELQVAAILAYLLTSGVLLWLKPCRVDVLDLIRTAARAQRQASQELRLPRRLSLPWLRISVRGDEAGILLTSSSITARVPAAIWRFLKFALTLSVPATLLSYLVYVGIFFAGLRLSVNESALMYACIALFAGSLVLSFLAVLCQVAMIVLPMIIRRLAFGPESLAQTWLMTIRPSLDPPNLRYSFRHYDLGRRWSQLNHCRIYDESAIVKDMLQWLDSLECTEEVRQVRGKAASPAPRLSRLLKRLRRLLTYSPYDAPTINGRQL